jgi:hypothetical protein
MSKMRINLAVEFINIFGVIEALIRQLALSLT